MNMAMLIGRVGKEPEIASTNSGKKIAKFSLATSEKWRNKNSGERREKTEWHNLVVFNEGLSKVVEQYVHKGDQLMIVGKITTREWEKDGSKRYSTEIVLDGFDAKLEMLGGSKGDREGSGDRGDDRGGRSDSRQDSRGASRSGGGGGSRYSSDDMNDDIPF